MYDRRDRNKDRDKDRDRYREKDRDRERDREKDRHKKIAKYSKSRSRSHSPQKKKSHKDKYKKNRKDRSSSSSKSRSSTPEKKVRTPSRSPSDEKLGIKLAKQIVEPFERKPLYVKEPDFKTTQEESSCLIITGLPEIMSQDQLEDLLASISTQQETSPPENIQLVSVLKTAYATYPSVEVAKKILFNLRGVYQIGSVKLTLDFYPNILAKQKTQGPSKDISLIQDWICDKCEYKNFAKRNKCHKCENPRNPNCKAVYNSACYVKQNNPQQNTNLFYTPITIDPNSTVVSTLQVRGAVLSELSETQLASLFEKYGPVKDAKFLKNKATGQTKESATIEFYTTEDAERVLKMTQTTDFRINGQQVNVSYAKKGKSDDTQQETKPTASPSNPYQNRQQYQGMAGGYNPYYSDVTYVSQGQEKPQQTGYAQMQNTQNYNFYQQQMYNQQLQQQLQQGVIQQTIQQQQQAQLQQQPQFQQQQVQQTPFVKPSTPIFQNIANMYAEKNKAAQAPVNLQAAALAKLTASSTTSTPTPKTSAESTPVQAAQNKIEIKFALPTTIQISTPINEPIIEENKESPSPPQDTKNKKASELIFGTEDNSKSPISIKLAENEMKKWEKEQKNKSQGNTPELGPQTSPSIPKFQLVLENTKVPQTQVQDKPKISSFTILQQPATQQTTTNPNAPKYRVFLGSLPVCRLCETKFMDLETSDLHEKFSKKHKENLARLKIN